MGMVRPMSQNSYMLMGIMAAVFPLEEGLQLSAGRNMSETIEGSGVCKQKVCGGTKIRPEAKKWEICCSNEAGNIEWTRREKRGLKTRIENKGEQRKRNYNEEKKMMSEATGVMQCPLSATKPSKQISSCN